MIPKDVYSFAIRCTTKHYIIYEESQPDHKKEIQTNLLFYYSPATYATNQAFERVFQADSIFCN